MAHHRNRRTAQRPRRHGAIAVLAALLLIVMLAGVAFSIDLGYLVLGRTQAQAAADAAAMAAAWQLLDARRLEGPDERDLVQSDGRNVAVRIAAEHALCGGYAVVNANAGNDPAGDVVFGRLDANRNISTTWNSRDFNAVQVRVRRTEDHHGRVSLFFGGLLGLPQATIEAQAVAEFRDEIRGFRTSDAQNVPILPFALQINSWNTLQSGMGADNWTCGPSGHTVYPGPDGVLELNLFPVSSAGGNFGTINIGNHDSASSDLRRQIREGVTFDDLAYHGGSLELGPNNTLPLPGDTGVDADLQEALPDALGKTRILPLYSTVSGTGHHAVYTIVGFAAVRIVKFELNSSQKQITVQPSVLLTEAAIPGGGTSYDIFRMVRLVR